MKLKITQVLVLNAANRDLSAQQMSFATAYKFNKLINSLQDDINFYNEKWREIAQKYCKHDDNGNVLYDERGFMTFEPAQERLAQQEIDELNGIEVDVIDIKFDLDELKALTISYNAAAVLALFVQE